MNSFCYILYGVLLFLFFASISKGSFIQTEDLAVINTNVHNINVNDSELCNPRELQLIAVGANGMIWAINGNTGEREWSFDTGSPLFSFHCSDTIPDPFLLIPSSKGELFTYSDGSLHNIGTTIQQLVAGTPLQTFDGSFWMASKVMQMWALDNTGKLIHSWTSNQDVDSNSLPRDWGEDILVITRVTYNVKAIDPLSGSVKWNISVSDFNTHTSDEPIIDSNEHVNIASDGSIFYYNENRKSYLWKSKLPAGIVTIFSLEKIINDAMLQVGGIKEYWRLHMPPKNPILPPHLTMNLESNDPRFPGVFVGIHEGSLYAIPVTSTYERQYSYDTFPQSHYPAIDDGIDDNDSNNFKDNSIALIEDSINSILFDDTSPPLDFPMSFIEISSTESTFLNNEFPQLPMIDPPMDITYTTPIIEIDESSFLDNKMYQIIMFNTAFAMLIGASLYIYNQYKSSKSKKSKVKQSSPIISRSHPPLTIGKLSVTNKILGHGSSGTIVYKGSLDGRTVAVKRMLREYFQLASKEIKMLQQSDEHPNVVRYYTHEKDQNFLYLALSFCKMNLDQLLQRGKLERKQNKMKKNIPIVSKKMIFDIVTGLQHIHSLHIIHRDIKPHNILIDPSGTLKISDMGLAKKLESDEHSFSSQTTSGTIGWQAPEQMDQSGRQSKKVDIFSLGCVIYYCLTEGEHPFGTKIQRENNIVENNHSLDKVKDPIAIHLIKKMIRYSPKDRITAKQASVHPFFWSPEKTLDFFRIASDRLESEKPSDSIVINIESKIRILGTKRDWLSQIDPLLKTELQTSKFRKYKGHKVRDLLRVIRNKTHHYRDLPKEMQENLGDLPNGFLQYWTSRFPYLLIDTYCTIEKFCKDEPNLLRFF